LPLFIAPRQLKSFIDKELLEGPLVPIDYVDGDRLVMGYDASVLVAVCNVWSRAREEGELQTQQLGKATGPLSDFRLRTLVTGALPRFGGGRHLSSP
jgi:hypothetical protein